MRITEEIHYAADPDAVARMLGDREFVLAKCEQMRSTRHTATVEGEAAGAFTVTSSRTMPTGEFPEIARRFVGSQVEIVQVESWQAPAPDGSRRGDVAVRVAGRPVSFTGTLALAPRLGGGTSETVDGTLSVGIPFVGGQLARLAEPLIRKAFHRENRTGQAWLAT